MAVLPLEYVACCVSLMTNKPHFRKQKINSIILKADIDVRNGQSSIESRELENSTATENLANGL